MKSPNWYFLVFIFPLSIVIGYLGGGVFNYLTLFLLYLILPLAELACGVDYKNPYAAEPVEHRFYRAILHAVVLSELVLVIWGAYAVSHALTLLEAIGFTIGIGINGGIAFCVAHELIHKHNRLDNWMGNIMLIVTATGHAPMEHVLVHHSPSIAATPADHVHAKSGQTFYQFYLKAMAGLRTAAYAAEKKRLSREGHHVLSLHNRLISLNLASIAFALSLTIIFGYQACLYFIGAAVVTSMIILAAAYIQHYGLERFVLADGTYEKFTELHSWNSNYVLTNYLLFQLPRHSLHHIQPALNYEVCYDNPANPQLPYGYFMSGILILIPKLWQKVMAKPISDNIALRKKLLINELA